MSQKWSKAVNFKNCKKQGQYSGAKNSFYVTKLFTIKSKKHERRKNQSGIR